MAAPFPSLTKTWHTNTYPAISPTRPEVSAVDKTVFITGGGTGIGASVARSFAAAGSKKIAILGRRREPLEKLATDLESEFAGLEVLVTSADVTNEAEVDAAFKKASKQFGPIDILVNNAGYAPTFGAITELDVAEAWIAFETNVKGSLLVARAFERAANKMEAIVIETSSIVAIMPPYVGSVSYTASKLAATKVWSFFGAENPQVRVIHVQPGQVQTDMADSIGLKNLPDHAKFLKGKFVCANWDVDELKALADEFEKTELGTITLHGLGPFAHDLTLDRD
ncbi:hypothetical protein S7711_07050 [Stachybotrys chartarum IBT 7711]|uniref:Ketoreductase domain-containing protein n=1 Tax=Stachybotrys chartarum (strain CBS 109288 / IBT 7711) TaxID=1280523 RepID=A0A084ASM4_STACB|nr:hypothetical protein S7711_07050 [Stachybotrys chartarum IBT 7711]